MLMMLASWGRVAPTGPGLAGTHDAGLLGPCDANFASLMLMMLASWGRVTLTMQA